MRPRLSLSLFLVLFAAAAALELLPRASLPLLHLLHLIFISSLSPVFFFSLVLVTAFPSLAYFIFLLGAFLFHRFHVSLFFF